MRLTPTRILLALFLSTLCLATWFVIRETLRDQHIAQKCQNTEAFQVIRNTLINKIVLCLSLTLCRRDVKMPHAMCAVDYSTDL
jgi:hypothetical protein